MMHLIGTLLGVNLANKDASVYGEILTYDAISSTVKPFSLNTKSIISQLFDVNFRQKTAPNVKHATAKLAAVRWALNWATCQPYCAMMD